MEHFDENFLNETIGVINDNESIDFEIEEYEAGPSPTCKRAQHHNPENWKQNFQKKKCLLGQEYVGQTKIDGQIAQTTKPALEMGTLCRKETCRNSKKKHCEKFTQDDCHKIFQQYWNSGNKVAQDTFLR